MLSPAEAHLHWMAPELDRSHGVDVHAEFLRDALRRERLSRLPFWTMTIVEYSQARHRRSPSGIESDSLRRKLDQITYSDLLTILRMNGFTAVDIKFSADNGSNTLLAVDTAGPCNRRQVPLSPRTVVELSVTDCAYGWRQWPLRRRPLRPD